MTPTATPAKSASASGGDEGRRAFLSLELDRAILELGLVAFFRANRIVANDDTTATPAKSASASGGDVGRAGERLAFVAKSIASSA